MRDGDWTAALYVDDQSSAAQQEALGQIFSGQVGGPMQRVSLLFSRFLGVKMVPMTFTMEGHTRRLVIPDILEVGVAAVTGRDGGGRCGPPMRRILSLPGWRWRKRRHIVSTITTWPGIPVAPMATSRRFTGRRHEARGEREGKDYGCEGEDRYS